MRQKGLCRLTQKQIEDHPGDVLCGDWHITQKLAKQIIREMDLVTAKARREREKGKADREGT